MSVADCTDTYGTLTILPPGDALRGMRVAGRAETDRFEVSESALVHLL